MEVPTISAEAWYQKQEALRAPYLDRAREVAKLTVPTLFAEAGDKSGAKFKTPFQSIGARGVNSLSSTLLMSLLPPNAPFFRLDLDEKVKSEMEGVEEVQTEVTTALADMERKVQKEIEIGNFRVGLFGALKQLVVAGNVLLHVPKEGSMRVFHLDRFVIQRDPMGNPQRIVIKEDIAKELLPEGLSSETPSDVETVSLFTSITYIDSKTVEVYQEIGGNRLAGSEGSYPKERSPFLPLRLNRVDGEDYGRGYVEEYLGDLESLEGLTQSIVEGSAASAKLLFMVRPNGSTRKGAIASADNGAIIDGDAGDVSTLQTMKHADFSVAFQTISQIQERLNYAFMLTDASIRQSERTTAEEVRLTIQTQDKQLGGVYSTLTQEFQLPFVRIIIHRMESGGKLAKLPKDMVQPMIVTGIEALGRGNDLNKLDSFVAGIGQLLGPEAINQFLNMSEFLERRAAALGLDTTGLIKTEEELQAEAQQAQQQQMMSTVGPQAMSAMSNQAQAQQQQQAPDGQ